MDDLKKVQTQPVKSKTAAIVIAVFLGYWSWLYTYKKNKRKFWIGLGVSLTLLASDIIVSILVLSAVLSGTAGTRLAEIRTLIGAPGAIGLVIIGVLYLANLVLLNVNTMTYNS